MARYYDLAMENFEKKVLVPRRRTLLADLHGTVLELGSGSGANLPYFENADHVFLSEPDRFMRRQLEPRLTNFPTPVDVLASAGEKVPLDDASVDFVVSTLVMCSVADPTQALREIRRVLKPGGKLLMLEHVASDRRHNLKWQNRVTPIWKHFAGNCHLNRPTASLVSDAGFQLDVERFVVDRATVILQDWIVGVAISPGDD